MLSVTKNNPKKTPLHSYLQIFLDFPCWCEYIINLCYVFMESGRKEGHVLFNDAFYTICLRIYGVRHMVKDQSDSERGNPLTPHGILFTISSKSSFICIIPQTGYHMPRPLLHQSCSTGWNGHFDSTENLLKWCHCLCSSL